MRNSLWWNLVHWKYVVGDRIESWAWRHNFCRLHRWAWVTLAGQTGGPCSHDRRTSIPCHPCGGSWSLLAYPDCDPARAEWSGKA